MNLKEVDELLHRYVNDESSPEEREQIEAWLVNNGYPKDQWISMSDGDKEQWLSTLFADIKRSSSANISGNSKRLPKLYPYIAAACVLILITAGALLFHKDSGRPQPVVKISAPAQKKDFAPGGNKALLILADGSSVELSNSAGGTLANQGDAAVSNTKDGKLIYQTLRSGNKERKAQMNQVVTPRGGQYELTLADGTRVWLNAASSLRFPVTFIGEERRVQLTGEAYFEVATAYTSVLGKKKKQSFIVESGGQEVDVLGTHFNINAYPEENGIKTTLLEGSVKVSFPQRSGLAKNAGSLLLKPGQQSTFNKGKVNVTHINTDEVIAWKNGVFMFDNANVYTLMNNISRWYDVEVEYKGKLPEISFGGTVSRFKNISELLKTIELTGDIKFKIEERRIIVMQ